MFANHPVQVDKTQKGHGHTRMLLWLRRQDPSRLRGKTLVEIGTVRELKPGQNSTAAFAKFCKDHDMHFVTVDMNPELTARANVQHKGFNFKAVCARGEDYIAETDDNIDFIYFDAFDFDHGKHSQKRKDDYQKYLQCSITNELCHKAHLEMAQALLDRHSPTMMTFDDTFYDEKTDTVDGKGALAVPLVVSKGWLMVNNWVFVRPESVEDSFKEPRAWVEPHQ